MPNLKNGLNLKKGVTLKAKPTKAKSKSRKSPVGRKHYA